MRIAVPQYTFSKDHKRMLCRALDEIASAGAQGADLVCFLPWFVALNPVAETGGDLTTQLCEAAQASHVAVLTGNIRIPNLQSQRHRPDQDVHRPLPSLLPLLGRRAVGRPVGGQGGGHDRCLRNAEL